MKKKKRKTKANKTRRGSFKAVFTEPLPPAITARITPLVYIGIISLVLTLIALIFRPTRGLAPFTGIITAALLGYSIWQRYEVISKGYREILFKVIDYTYLTRLSKSPTGMLLVKKLPDGEDDRGAYHIALSGKEDLPPIGWLIKAFVPADLEPAEYNGRKYFPTVFGYSLEGEDSSNR